MIRQSDKRLNYPRLPKAYVEAIEPDQCLRYLESRGWRRDKVVEQGEIVQYRHPAHRDFVLQLPLTRKYADYALVLAFAITTAAAQEKRPFWEVYMDMAGRYYVGPRTYSTTPQANGSTNRAADHGGELLPNPLP